LVKAVRLWTLKDTATRSGAGNNRANTIGGLRERKSKASWIRYHQTFRAYEQKLGSNRTMLLEKFDEGNKVFCGRPRRSLPEEFEKPCCKQARHRCNRGTASWSGNGIEKRRANHLLPQAQLLNIRLMAPMGINQKGTSNTRDTLPWRSARRCHKCQINQARGSIVARK
jgi:hypothetical protein